MAGDRMVLRDRNELLPTLRRIAIADMVWQAGKQAQHDLPTSV